MDITKLKRELIRTQKWVATATVRLPIFYNRYRNFGCSACSSPITLLVIDTLLTAYTS